MKTRSSVFCSMVLLLLAGVTAAVGPCPDYQECIDEAQEELDSCREYCSGPLFCDFVPGLGMMCSGCPRDCLGDYWSDISDCNWGYCPF